MSRRRVVVLTTGGTIASTATAAAGVIAGSEHDPLGALVEGWGDAPGPHGVHLERREVLRTGSYALDLPQARSIARAVVGAAADPGTAGVVVTHGTDTMEESAYLCDLLHPGDTPVVFCGAQRPADHPEPDGPGNLRDAVVLASSPGARGTGVLVAMAGEAYAARDAVKVDTALLRAFSARTGGAVARVGPGGAQVLARPPRSTSLSGTDHLEERVALVATHLGDDGSLLRAAVDGGARGLVLQALGKGNAPPPVTAAAADAVSAGVPVVVTTRCSRGRVAATYGGGGGHDLRAAGAWFARDLAPSKARVLLMAVLAATDGAAAREALFTEHADLRTGADREATGVGR